MKLGLSDTIVLVLPRGLPNTPMPQDIPDASVRFDMGTRPCASVLILGSVRLRPFQFWGASVCVHFRFWGAKSEITNQNYYTYLWFPGPPRMKGAEDVRAQPWYDSGASVCVRFSFWVRPFASVSDFGGRPQPSGKTDASIRYAPRTALRAFSRDSPRELWISRPAAQPPMHTPPA